MTFVRIKRKQGSNRKIVYDLSCSEIIRKYFHRGDLFVEYDTEINSVDESILSIPIVSAVITIAWALGADVYIDELDETYLRSLNSIKLVLKRWYPDFSMATEIQVKKLVANRFSNKGHGLLFTYGIDSTASYIRHRAKKPQLINILAEGSHRMFSHEDALELKRKMSDFIKHEGIDRVQYIRTNLPPSVSVSNNLFQKFGLGWYTFVAHGLVQTSLCAPLTQTKKIGTLLIASGYIHENNRYPWGSHPDIDNKVAWADVKVVHDPSRRREMSKLLKIKILKKYFKESGYYPSLMVCGKPRASNCERCSKCMRIIAGLCLYGIDPNKFGFTNVTKGTFDRLKQYIEKDLFKREELIVKRGTLISQIYDFYLYHDIQMNIPENLEHDLYGSKEFFSWFKDLDLSKLYMESKNIGLSELPWMSIKYIYTRLPPIARTIVKKFSYR